MTRKSEKPGAASVPAYKSEDWPLDRIKPYGKNPREHNRDHIKKVIASIKEFGFTVPVLVDEAGVLLAGHGRLMAATKLKLDRVPVRIVTGLSDDQKRAYRIADNQLTIDGRWNESLLAEELKLLDASDFDLDLTGFDTIKVDGYLRGLSAGELDPKEEWKKSGMPEFENEDIQSGFKTMTIRFADEQAMHDFAKLVGQSITKDTRSIWFPEQERDETYMLEVVDGDAEEVAGQ